MYFYRFKVVFTQSSLVLLLVETGIIFIVSEFAWTESMQVIIILL